MGPALLPIHLKSLTLGIAEDGAPLDKTATPQLLLLINLVLRRIRALSVMSLAIGVGPRDCPTRKNRPREEAGVNPVLTVSANMSPTKIYVTAEINGHPVKCLLDSGCERSVVG